MKILFITNESSRTGAPLMLLYFMTWLKDKHPNVSFDCLSLSSGNLDVEFAEVSNHFFLFKKVSPTFIERVLYFSKRKTISFDNVKRKEFLHNIVKNDYDIVYANTIPSLNKSIELISGFVKKPKLIFHSHELEVIMQLMGSKFNENIAQINEIIAASELVKENLVTNWNAPKEKIKVVYEMTKISDDINLRKKTDSDFIVGASGQVHWRKSPDVFIQVAYYLHKNHPNIPIKFQWVGSISDFEKSIIEEDLKKLGIKDKVDFIGSKDEPHSFFQNFNIFLMPSREDPFPLVCIEAGLMGVPTICFEGATGIQEVLINGGGTIVPYLDVEAMASQVLHYFENRELLQKDSQIAREIFSEYTPEKIAPQLYTVLEDVISK